MRRFSLLLCLGLVSAVGCADKPTPSTTLSETRPASSPNTSIASPGEQVRQQSMDRLRNVFKETPPISAQEQIRKESLDQLKNLIREMRDGTDLHTYPSDINIATGAVTISFRRIDDASFVKLIPGLLPLKLRLIMTFNKESTITEVGFTEAFKLPNLVGLEFIENSKILQAFLKTLPESETIEYLLLLLHDVTSANLAPLSRLKKLHFLTVYENKLSYTDEVFAPLADLTELRKLDGLAVRTIVGMKHLSKLSHLENLTLECYKGEITDEVVMMLKNHPELRKLKFGNCNRTGKMTREGLVAIAKLPKLEDLHLDWSETDPSDYVMLAPLAKTLRKFRYNCNEVEILNFMADLNELEEIHPQNNDHTDGLFKAAAKFPRLRILEEYGFSKSITDAGVADISVLKNLETLNLSSSKVTDTGLESLAKMGSLKRLELWYTGITDSSIPTLLALPKLKYVAVKGSKMTPEGIKILKAKRGLIVID